MGFSHDWWLPAAWRCCPVTLAACSGDASPSDAATAAFSTRRPTVTHDSLDKAQVPSVRDDSPHAKAVRAVESMSVEERVGQLVMAPLFAGSDPSSLYDLIANRHVGSVLIIGNWTSGIARGRGRHIHAAIVCSGRQPAVDVHRSGGWSGPASQGGRVRYHAFGHPAGRNGCQPVEAIGIRMGHAAQGCGHECRSGARRRAR